MAKIATIKNFSNMDDNGVFYLEGMAARKINGKSILSPSFYNSFVLSESTTKFSALGLVRGGTPIDINQGSTLMYDDTGNIYEYNYYSGTLGKLHTVANSDTPDPDSSFISFGDIVATKNEHILYSTRDALGKGYLGTATGGSTTTLVDSAVNFTTLGISATTGSNKMYDINNLEEYTITSLTGTTQLNFSAGTAVAVGHKYIVFSDIGVYNAGAYFNFFATTAYPQFTGQEDKSAFKRQIELFDDEYLIGNGNFLAALNVNETTWNDNRKQLPDQNQFQCMATNQDKILVGATKRGKGALLLWDGYSDGWLAIEELEEVPTCIKPYQGGWVVTIGDSLYYTNGYQSKAISKIPDTSDINSNLGAFYNSMMVISDRIILGLNGSDSGNRAKSGLYVYEFGSGWSITPYNNNAGYQLDVTAVGAVFSVVDYPANPSVRKIYSAFSGDGTNNYCVNSFVNRSSLKHSAMFYLTLPKKMNISQIILNVSPQFDKQSGSGNTVISLAVGEGKYQFWRRTQVATTSTTTVIKNTQASTADYAGVVGHQIRSLSGDTSGERSYVTSITNAGTASEELTISPALSATPLTNSFINLLPLKLADVKTFSGLYVPDEIPFTVEGFYSDKLFFEIYFDASSGQLLDIHSIDIYGE